ncbi:sigma-E factor negative regulatory protein [Undibacterium rugosum]|uniref:Sigma-E factor negative regulatory protein n=1 Tax=Undibacterium rugosum TaxID=2762291 RepID=A0A923KSW7_9BURK|nr:sigma-E factor negative regulatory protein [Undibacterium rugosum]MBC3935389.1 sigma-E factor negative regulatory protein [Undibacterium rugosum]MBR7778836.1 sigma-E factor negative regulatory protein [Undibacterium rugosum]
MMMKNTTQQENLSALMDGETDDAQLEAAIAELIASDDKTDWDIYHQIGDVLRSDDLAQPMSADFTARFAARFESEPVLLMPALHQREPDAAKRSFSQSLLRSYAGVAGIAAAAMLALVIAPKILQPAVVSEQAPVARNATPEIQLASARVQTAAAAQSAIDGSEQAAKTGNSNQMDMLRDPRIDSYLIAHQRFSPAISSGAQYVTRANVVTPAAEK